MSYIVLFQFSIIGQIILTVTLLYITYIHLKKDNPYHLLTKALTYISMAILVILVLSYVWQVNYDWFFT